MSSHQAVGSALRQEVVQLAPVFGPEGKPAPDHFQPKALGTGSFSTTYQWRGNGSARLNLLSGWIGSGSRVVASISEYDTAWNADRFLGDASMQVLNVAPYNGGVWVDVSVGWNSPLNVCVTLIVDP